MFAPAPVYTAVSRAHERRPRRPRDYPRRLADYRAAQTADAAGPGRIAPPPVVAAPKRARFDEAAFRAGWRALAAERGVDRLQGATSFQVAGWKAERAERARAADALTWWQDPEKWKYAGGYRSWVEEAAVDALFDEAGGKHMEAKGKIVAIRRRQLSSLRRGGCDGSALKPLREVLQARGEQLSFVAFGAGGVLSFVVPLRPEGLTESAAGLG